MYIVLKNENVFYLVLKLLSQIHFRLGPLIIEVPEGKRIRKSAKNKEKFDESQRQAPEEVSQNVLLCCFVQYFLMCNKEEE